MLTISTDNLIAIGAAIGIMGSIFAIYQYFRKPQIDSEQTDALLKIEMKNMEVMFNEKFAVLTSTVVNLRDNHIHSLDTKVDETNKNLNLMAVQVSQLATIIDERIPRKGA